ncbi:MAG: hypothetical protein AAF668_06555 [Pseudomonadota bacterium]
MSNNRPEDVIRDGNLKASIWRNEGENGPYYSTTLARSYKDEKGKYHDTQSFSGSELLRVSELSRQAYTRSNELWRKQNQSRDKRQDREADSRDEGYDDNGRDEDHDEERDDEDRGGGREDFKESRKSARPSSRSRDR